MDIVIYKEYRHIIYTIISRLLPVRSIIIKKFGSYLKVGGKTVITLSLFIFSVYLSNFLLHFLSFLPSFLPSSIFLHNNIMLQAMHLGNVLHCCQLDKCVNKRWFPSINRFGKTKLKYKQWDRGNTTLKIDRIELSSVTLPLSFWHWKDSNQRQNYIV